MAAINSGRAPTKFMIMMPWGRVGSNQLLSNIEQVADPRKARLANEKFIAIKDSYEQIEWTRQFYGDVEGFDLIGSKQNILSVRNLDDMGGLLAAAGVKLIRMRRANFVKVAVSQLRAELYAQKNLASQGIAFWGVMKGQEPLGPVALKPQRFCARLLEREKPTCCYLNSHRLSRLWKLSIEIQIDPGGVTARVCEWLGMTVEQEIVPSFIKATPDDLSLAVPNLDQLRAVLRASPLAHLDQMFDE